MAHLRTILQIRLQRSKATSRATLEIDLGCANSARCRIEIGRRSRCQDSIDSSAIQILGMAEGGYPLKSAANWMPIVRPRASSDDHHERRGGTGFRCSVSFNVLGWPSSSKFDGSSHSQSPFEPLAAASVSVD